jgi:hypothetical protein
MSSSLTNADPGTHMKYEIDLPVDCRTEFTAREKQLLRPIAETLALLDGNAWFDIPGPDGGEFYEMYLSGAWEVFHSNGGETGAAGDASWVKCLLAQEQNPTLGQIWDQYQTALRLMGYES